MRNAVNWFLPGTVFFLMGAVAVGAAMLYGGERLRRAGRLWLTLIAIFYIIASTRLGANLLLAPLRHHTSYLTDAAAAQGASGVVLLNPGADSYRARGQLLSSMAQESALRVIEAARVYRLLGDPVVIVVGGVIEQTDRPSLGSIMAKGLVELGVPPGRIVIEPNSRNTRQHVENLKPYLERHNVRRFVLVTSPTHMRRSIAVFRAAGFDFVTSAAADDSDLSGPGSDHILWPDRENLDRVVYGGHEYLGLLYYWWNDWI